MVTINDNRAFLGVNFFRPGAFRHFLGPAFFVGVDLAVMGLGHLRIGFELGATLHTVRGQFQLTSGDLTLDLEAGELGGRAVVDARSGDTDNATRDANMHEQVLESATVKRGKRTEKHKTEVMIQVKDVNWFNLAARKAGLLDALAE